MHLIKSPPAALVDISGELNIPLLFGFRAAVRIAVNDAGFDAAASGSFLGFGCELGLAFNWRLSSISFAIQLTTTNIVPRVIAAIKLWVQGFIDGVLGYASKAERELNKVVGYISSACTEIFSGGFGLIDAHFNVPSVLREVTKFGCGKALQGVGRAAVQELISASAGVIRGVKSAILAMLDAAKLGSRWVQQYFSLTSLSFDGALENYDSARVAARVTFQFFGTSMTLGVAAGRRSAPLHMNAGDPGALIDSIVELCKTTFTDKVAEFNGLGGRAATQFNAIANKAKDTLESIGDVIVGAGGALGRNAWQTWSSASASACSLLPGSTVCSEVDSCSMKPRCIDSFSSTVRGHSCGDNNCGWGCHCIRSA